MYLYFESFQSTYTFNLLTLSIYIRSAFNRSVSFWYCAAFSAREAAISVSKKAVLLFNATISSIT